MLDELNPLTGERAVLAQMARQLAATLDGMDPAMSARMAGQTRGQLLKVLDKLGAQRREEGPAGAAAQDASSVRPRRQATRSGSRASKTSSTPKSCRGSSRSTPAGWGSQCLAPWRTPNPWAVDTWQWVQDQKQRWGDEPGIAGIAGDNLAIVR
jgi:hypothetical protein